MNGQSRPRTPGVAYAAIVVVLVVVLAVFAATQRQPPPPTIAEFAPQAVDNITEAPTDQSSSSGRSGGAGGGGDADGDVPSPSASPVDVPRVRKCVGDPPRQIEDPQSPPCVPYWSGDNGGATSKGVTRDEIRIAAPQHNPNIHDVLARFFNTRFEFYGRQVRFVKVTHGNGDPAVQRANAVEADAARVFASTSYTNGLGGDYYDELARRRIISAASAYSPLTESSMRASAPYKWQYPMAADRMFANVGEWMCKRIVRQSARHAGDPALAGRERRIGVIVELWNETDVSNRPILEQLERCGVTAAYSENQPSKNSLTPSDYTNVVLQLRDAGVTTVVCMCHSVDASTMSKSATSQGYFPEWITSTYIDGDDNYAVIPFWGKDQLAHNFGLTFRPRQQLPENEPSRWAIKEVDPARGGSSEDTSLNRWTEKLEYQPLLLLMSGIQMAGPRLTPQSFEAGLHKTLFPNPPHPINAGAVGFQDADHSMTDDAAEFWWDPQARSPYADQTGSACYVAGGVRHRLGSWPATQRDPFFEGACDSGA